MPVGKGTTKSNALTARANDGLLDLTVQPVRRKPYEHVLCESFIALSAYQELSRSYPSCPPRIGPTGFSCYWGDPDYDALIADNAAWRSLFDAFHSQRFVDYMITQFGETCRKNHCVVDLSKAKYVPYQESRKDKESRHIADVVHAPHELWVRMDIHQAHVGYTRVRHLDHRRRLMTLLVYFSDATENTMQGGDLVLHRKQKSWTSWGDVVVRPAHNRMVAFACHANSWHSVPETVSQAAPRNFLQITVSSSVDAWP